MAAVVAADVVRMVDIEDAVVDFAVTVPVDMDVA